MAEIPGIRAFVIYSEVFFQKPTPRSLQLLLERMPIAIVLGRLSSIAQILNNNAAFSLDAVNQSGMLSDHSDVPWIQRLRSLIVNDNRVLVHITQIGILARCAIAYCPDDAVDEQVGENFVRALLMVSELFGETHRLPGVDAATPESFIGLEAQNLMLSQERLFHVLYRNERFFEWLRAIEADDPDFLDVSTDLKRLTEMTYEEHTTASFAFFTQFLMSKNAKDLSQNGGLRSLATMCSTLTEKSAINAWLARYSMPIEEAREKFRREAFTFRTADLLPFLERPVIVAEGDVLICPVPQFIENTLGTGFYFLLFDSYKLGSEESAMKFARLYGRFFEDYCREIIRWGIDATDLILSGDERYRASGGESRTTDVIIQGASSSTAFVEITKKRFNLVRTVVDGDVATLEKDLDQMIVQKATQIGRTLADMEAKLWSPDLPVSQAVPIIVTGQEIPGMLGIAKLIREKIELAAPFRDLATRTTPVLYMSVDELEALCVAFDGHLDIAKFVIDKQCHKDLIARASSVRNYLYLFCAESRRSADTPSRQLPGMGDFVQRVLLPVAKAWGIPVDLEVLAEP